MKKKIDERIITLIENCVKMNQRSMFLIIGDRGLYQVSNWIKLTLLYRLWTYIKFWLKHMVNLNLVFFGAIRKNLSSPVTNKSVLNKWEGCNKKVT